MWLYNVITIPINKLLFWTRYCKYSKIIVLYLDNVKTIKHIKLLLFVMTYTPTNIIL